MASGTDSERTQDSTRATAPEGPSRPAPSFLRGFLWVPRSPPEPGTQYWCHRPTVLDPSPLQHARPLPSGPSSSTCPEASTARASSTGAQTPRPLPSRRPSTTCLGLRAPLPPPPAPRAPPSSAPMLAPRASSLGPLAPYLTTSPSFGHHVPTSGPPLHAAGSSPSVGNWSPGTVWGPVGRSPRPCPRRAASPRGAPRTLRTARPQVPGAARFSLSRSPALLLLLRAPLDRIGQQCGACHWSGEADGTLIGRPRAPGAPRSTVSERFETPKASGREGGAGEEWRKVGQKER